MLLHEPGKLLFVDGQAALARKLAGQLDREPVGRRQRERVVAGDITLRRDLVEEPQAACERLGETVLLRTQDVLDRLPVLLELRIPGGRLLDDDVREPPEVLEADLARLLDGAADDPTQDVSAALVRRDDAVTDEERH